MYYLSCMSRLTVNIPGHIHFLTCSFYHRFDLLASSTACQLLGAALRDARETAQFDLWAYVFMPNHVHLLIRPRSETYSMAAIQRSFKEPFAREFVQLMRQNDTHLLKLLRFGQNPRWFHRVWQRGGGFDRNLYTSEYVRRAAAYTEANPVRRGLVESPGEWRWSSARVRAGYSDAPAPIDTCDSLI